jgi:hypothetical protein
MSVSASAKYPCLPFVDDVQVVFDVGAHDGVASVHFARHYPEAVIHTLEPDAAGTWCREQGLTRIDVMNLAAEGAADVLAGVEELLPTVKVLYVEYDSRETRRRIRDLMSATHELYTGALYLDQGEIIYLRKDYAALEAATPTLRDLLAAGLGVTATAAAGTAERDPS